MHAFRNIGSCNFWRPASIPLLKYTYVVLYLAMLPTWLSRWLPRFGLLGHLLFQTVEWYTVSVLLPCWLTLLIRKCVRQSGCVGTRSGGNA